MQNLHPIGTTSKKSNSQSYSYAIFDCLVAVFGKGHREVEKALINEGVLKVYLKRQESTNIHIEAHSLTIG